MVANKQIVTLLNKHFFRMTLQDKQKILRRVMSNEDCDSIYADLSFVDRKQALYDVTPENKCDDILIRYISNQMNVQLSYEAVQQIRSSKNQKGLRLKDSIEYYTRIEESDEDTLSNISEDQDQDQDQDQEDQSQGNEHSDSDNQLITSVQNTFEAGQDDDNNDENNEPDKEESSEEDEISETDESDDEENNEEDDIRMVPQEKESSSEDYAFSEQGDDDDMDDDDEDSFLS